MKRIFSILLALTLMLALAVPAFATEVEPVTGASSKSQDVTATYTAPSHTSTGTVYYVTIQWEQTADKNLAYTGEQATYTWNGTSMKYEKNQAGYVAAGWSGKAGYEVTVTNQSNGEVKVVTNASNDYELALSVPNPAEINLTSAAVDSNGQAIDIKTDTIGTKQIAKFTYTYEAKPGAVAPVEPQEETITVGTIRVTISKVTT